MEPELILVPKDWVVTSMQLLDSLGDIIERDQKEKPARMYIHPMAREASRVLGLYSEGATYDHEALYSILAAIAARAASSAILKTELDKRGMKYKDLIGYLAGIVMTGAMLEQGIQQAAAMRYEHPSPSQFDELTTTQNRRKKCHQEGENQELSLEPKVTTASK